MSVHCSMNPARVIRQPPSTSAIISAGQPGVLLFQGGAGAVEKSSSTSPRVSAPSASRSKVLKRPSRNCSPVGDNSIAWSGWWWWRPARRSSRSVRSSRYPNCRRTAQVVSMRPRSMKRAWRSRKPGRVSPREVAPLGSFAPTICRTPASSSGCRGVLKHATWNWLSSVSDRIPSQSASHSRKIRRSAATHRGRNCCVCVSKRGAVGCSTALRA
mmetsp:Transcript_22206/g.48753  ORF Transcript_22206/g.48753 Transcript_22206/m.48753 type:complete len:214 (-) Transcript_22206:818-1459(-)